MEGRIDLPKPSYRGTRTLEEVLLKRRSNRAFKERGIEMAAVSQILWAGQGLRDDAGHRTAPSAGGRYPLDLYVIDDQNVTRYIAEDHQLERHLSEDPREKIYQATLFQDAIRQAPLVIVMTADFGRAEQQHGAQLAERFAFMEAGHVAQNMLLQAYAMGLAGAAFGAFNAKQVRKILQLPRQQLPVYVMAIGYARS